jgi:hypothetical protein
MARDAVVINYKEKGRAAATLGKADSGQWNENRKQDLSSAVNQWRAAGGEKMHEVGFPLGTFKHLLCDLSWLFWKKESSGRTESTLLSDYGAVERLGAQGITLL